TKIGKSREPYAIPALCKARNRNIVGSEKQSVGDYAFQRPEGASRIFRASPDFDGVTVDAALALVQSMKLGQGEATDVLSLSLSATDYIGHAFGTGGLEMCIQMSELDRNLGILFSALDEQNIDSIAMLTSYVVVHDLPERLKEQGLPYAERIDPDLIANYIVAQIGESVALAVAELLINAARAFGD